MSFLKRYERVSDKFLHHVDAVIKVKLEGRRPSKTRVDALESRGNELKGMVRTDDERKAIEGIIESCLHQSTKVM